MAFCPHCDGPFFKGRRVAVVGGGNPGIEAALAAFEDRMRRAAELQLNRTVQKKSCWN